MTQTAAKAQRERDADSGLLGNLESLEDSRPSRELLLGRLRLLWSKRQFLSKATAAGLVAATLLALVIPKRYESRTQLMPPDSQSSSGLAMMAALSGQAGGLGVLAGDLLGIKSTGALFTGVLKSRTVQDRLIERFDLQKVYGARLQQAAREKLAENTAIAEDRKSGIISLTVTDHDPKRAAAIARAYVEELDNLMTQLTTSSAHRERIFLEERLAAVKQDLESAEKDFSQFASKNATIDITTQAKAMVEGAAVVEGQLIAAQSEVEGLKQIYTDSNVRVRAAQARVDELRHQLEKLGGKAESVQGGNAAPGDSGYPTLRQLPILGVPYADKFRHLKVEEAVFETLTKQYELAKVEEAKEIPTVKVLDPAEVPESKSYPPRLLIVLLGTIFSAASAIVCVSAQARWRETDSRDPAKLLAQEVFRTATGWLPRPSWNGRNRGSHQESLGLDMSSGEMHSESEEHV